MYEFKHLGRLGDNEIQVLSRRTGFIKDESFFHDKKVVLILDGLDERQITDGSDYALKDFIRNMFVLSEKINKIKDSRLNLIFTGRSQFVKSIGSAFTSAYHQFEIEDFSKEQVESWLKKYCTVKKIDPFLKYEDFETKHLEELIHQPILLTISAMMLADEGGRELISQFQGTISRGDIYRTIIRWTYQKKWQYHPNCDALPDEASYCQFLQFVAFIMFRHGEEKIKISTLIDALKKGNKLYDLELIKNKDDESIEEICRQLAISFFFKGLEEKAFSFIHKSIKDYLIAEAIFKLLKEATENFKPKKTEKSCDDMAADIYFILGKSGIDKGDHIPFLKDIIVYQKQASKELFTPLKEFFNLAQGHIYLIKNEDNQNTDPLKTEANVLSGLLYMLTDIFHSLLEDEKKEFHPDGYLKLFEQDSLYKFISFLNGCEYLGFYKKGFNLSQSYLRGAYLTGANLTGANLTGAYLTGADLRFADLTGADLTGTDLTGTDLTGAYLTGANLRFANLTGAYLTGAYLRDADLTGADLTGADLTVADLAVANLAGAGLRGADLRGADLTVADLAGADLTGTDLTGTDLTKAKQDEHTILPA
ncbi:MAG: pentapeptide repeat-containing protein [Desulfobacterales bacterium]|nr:pentapeptide repeat-containing protein [Desulfobacterales bacterium]